ncbi:sensor histidine kinase [Nonomuraea sediminis]|uniref:sensor histidine kinase n=1 Tax=Nonomuraea sediminis TaxID=2835864 RepID=UPI001BDCC389|nr:histidine kinase [Nonomuraea sediminis]
MITAWRALPALVRDAPPAMVTALVVIGVPLLSGAVFTPLWGVLVCAVCAPLILRRRLPVTAALASGAVVLIATAIGLPQVGAWVAVASFGSAAYYHNRWRPLPAIAATCWLIALQFVMGGGLSSLPVSLAAGLCPVALGHALRLQHDRSRQLALVERAEERARIARDVHDVVGHHLAAIRLQAVGARRASPADAAHALDAIAEVSATALGETRRLLGLLRDDACAAADLDSLAVRLSRHGLRVRLDGADLVDRAPLPVRLGVYRIVQESLTNVMRHAGASQAVVRIGRSARGVVVVVEDEGRAGGGAVQEGAVQEGQGVRGMRERAAELGGTLTAGPRLPRGWRVTADLPVDPAGRGARAWASA